LREEVGQDGGMIVGFEELAQAPAENVEFAIEVGDPL
jgi:hypothetical protein